MRPELLILDEPFEGLDSRSRTELVTLLNKRNSEGMTIIMSTHDLNLVAGFADRVYVLAKGHGVITAGTPADIFLAGRGAEGVQHRPADSLRSFFSSCGNGECLLTCRSLLIRQ